MFLYFKPFLFEVPIKRRYIRNPNQKEFDEGNMLLYVGKDDEYDEKDFIPVEIKAGKYILLFKYLRSLFYKKKKKKVMLLLFMVK